MEGLIVLVPVVLGLGYAAIRILLDEAHLRKHPEDRVDDGL